MIWMYQWCHHFIFALIAAAALSSIIYFTVCNDCYWQLCSVFHYNKVIKSKLINFQASKYLKETKNSDGDIWKLNSIDFTVVFEWIENEKKNWKGTIDSWRRYVHSTNIWFSFSSFSASFFIGTRYKIYQSKQMSIFTIHFGLTT